MYHLNTKITHNATLRILLKGQSLSKGCSIGTAFLFRDVLKRDILSYTIAEEDIYRELARIKGAIDIVLLDLQKLSHIVRHDLGADQADIFEAHKQILIDQQLYQDMELALSEELLNAEQIVRMTFQKWSKRFALAHSQITRSKAEDIQDLGRRLLNALLGYHENILKHLPHNSIVIAKRLLPSDTVHLQKKHVRGIAVEIGGYNSHSAILARALGVPAVTNLVDVMNSIEQGQELLIDGDQGHLIIEPNQSDKQYFYFQTTERIKEEQEALESLEYPIVMSNGEPVVVMSNASSKEEVITALRLGCDGIGLFRIEQLYLARQTLPTEYELYTQLKKIFHQVPDQSVTVRLLDVGGDKCLPYIKMADDISPMLGMRGVRVLLKHENLLKSQLRALLLLHQDYQVRVLVPMVTLPREMIQIRSIARECEAEMTERYQKPFVPLLIGAMIETPAAVINMEELCPVADFFSIGTNDLIQYTMAAGRENSSVYEYYVDGAQVILHSLKRIIEVAKAHQKSCCLCGELAADVTWSRELLRVGIRQFSVVPQSIPNLKKTLREWTKI